MQCSEWSRHSAGKRKTPKDVVMPIVLGWFSIPARHTRLRESFSTHKCDMEVETLRDGRKEVDAGYF